MSNYLVRRATVGTVVQLDQAAGEFVMDTPAPAKVLFITAGSGITPVMGMLRSLPADAPSDIVVVHSAPTAADVIFGGELRMLANQNRIRLVEIHTDADGMLAIDTLDDLVGGLAQYHTWACGPAALLDAIENHWAAAGIAHQLNTERFRPNISAIGDGGSVTFSVTDAPSRTTRAEPPRHRRASRPACSCPRVAGWGSASAAWRLCGKGSRARPGLARSPPRRTATEWSFRPASPLPPASAKSNSEP